MISERHLRDYLIAISHIMKQGRSIKQHPCYFRRSNLMRKNFSPPSGMKGWIHAQSIVNVEVLSLIVFIFHDFTCNEFISVRGMYGSFFHFSRTESILRRFGCICHADPVLCFPLNQKESRIEMTRGNS